MNNHDGVSDWESGSPTDSISKWVGEPIQSDWDDGREPGEGKCRLWENNEDKVNDGVSEQDDELAGSGPGEEQVGDKVAWLPVERHTLQVIFSQKRKDFVVVLFGARKAMLGWILFTSMRRSTFSVSSFEGIQFTSKSYESHVTAV